MMEDVCSSPVSDTVLRFQGGSNCALMTARHLHIFQLLLFITAKYLLFVRVTFLTCLPHCSRLLIKCSFFSPAIKLLLKEKKREGKPPPPPQPLCNQPLCRLFLLISPQQFHPLCHFRLAGPQRRGCRATVCLLECLLSVLVVKRWWWWWEGGGGVAGEGKKSTAT